MKKLKASAVLFDKDGTLIEFSDGFFFAVDQIITELSDGNLELTERLAKRLNFDRELKTAPHDSPIIAGTPLQIAQLLKGDLNESDPQALALRMNKRFEELTANDVRAIDGCADCLTRIGSGGLSLGVATNDGEENARANLAHTNLIHHFDFFAGYDSGFGPKPEPGMVLAFAEQMEVSVDKVVMVGDSQFDMMAGRNAGAMCVGIAQNKMASDALAGLADVIIASVADLDQLLDF